jgi:allantoin racemase
MITDEADLPVAAEEVLRIGLLEAALVDDYCRRVLRFRCRDASRPVFHPLVGIGKAAVHEAGSGGRRFDLATTTPALAAFIGAVV